MNESESNNVGGSSGSNATSPMLKKMMKRLMIIIVDYENSEGRILSEPFLKLPSAEEHPNYYEITEEPIAIKEIVTKIENDVYSEIDELERDFMRLCGNCQHYNEETSTIYSDSLVLQSLFIQARERLEHRRILKETRRNQRTSS